jgi:hypothetical protein
MKQMTNLHAKVYSLFSRAAAAAEKWWAEQIEKGAMR